VVGVVSGSVVVRGERRQVGGRSLVYQAAEQLLANFFLILKKHKMKKK